MIHHSRLSEEPDLRLRGQLAAFAQLQRRADELAQRVEIERLGNEVECAELERAHGRLDMTKQLVNFLTMLF